MSGTATKSIGAAGTTTEVAITLRRDVAKVAVQASLSPAFADKYPGTVRITSVKLSRSAMQTPYFGGTPKTGAMTFTHTQTPGETSGRFNALFYCFENAALASGSRVLLTLDGVYDRDGKTSTTPTRSPISYKIELSGTAGNGQLARNGYYRVAIGLDRSDRTGCDGFHYGRSVGNPRHSKHQYRHLIPASETDREEAITPLCPLLYESAT